MCLWFLTGRRISIRIFLRILFLHVICPVNEKPHGLVRGVQSVGTASRVTQRIPNTVLLVFLAYTSWPPLKRTLNISIPLVQYRVAAASGALSCLTGLSSRRRLPDDKGAQRQSGEQVHFYSQRSERPTPDKANTYSDYESAASFPKRKRRTVSPVKQQSGFWGNAHEELRGKHWPSLYSPCRVCADNERRFL